MEPSVANRSKTALSRCNPRNANLHVLGIIADTEAEFAARGFERA